MCIRDRYYGGEADNQCETSRITKKKLNQLAESKNVTRTYLVKKALNKYITEKEEKKDPHQLGKDLFGKYGSIEIIIRFK